MLSDAPLLFHASSKHCFRFALFHCCRQCPCRSTAALFPFTHWLGVRLTAWDTYLEAASYSTFDSPSGWHRLGSWCLTTSGDWRGFQEVTPCQAARPATTRLHVISYKGQHSWYFCIYASVSSDVCKDFQSYFNLLLFLVTWPSRRPIFVLKNRPRLGHCLI